MEILAEDKRRSLSDLRSNLETGLYSPASLGAEGEVGGLNPIGPISRGEKTMEGTDLPANSRLALQRNGFNSSDKAVSGKRLA